MKLFLTSLATLSHYENDTKVGSTLNNSNNFIENLRKNCTKTLNFVYIANNPFDYEDNDISGKFVFDAFLAQGFMFSKLTILDNRNSIFAKNYIETADIIFIRGGKLEPAIDFIKSNNIDQYLKTTNAVIIGQSAGAMILSHDVYQYPESKEEFDLPRFILGAGFFNIMIIPHFNTVYGNEMCDGTFHPLKDFFIPDSHNRKFLAIENGSYIVMTNNKTTVFGNAYYIADGKIKQICSTNHSLEI